MEYYLVVSTFMMFAGIYGFFTRRNLLAMLISVELILNSVDINFAVFNRYLFPEEVGSVCGALLPFGSRFPQTCLRTVRTCSHVYGSPLITLIYLP